ncbi:MAG: DUF1015 domain-containing protein [Desulfobacterales bacterium]|jgi:uncharacterized protein (DUF1015 family)|nr:DUF1015 domain-containing protein [Desulfobacterales bacterium]
MARILPFQGIHYNLSKIGNYANVATPPYDVIPEAQRNMFHERHPNNVIRLILGKPTDADTPQNNPHTRAAAFFREWLAKNILLKSPEAALYLTAVDFPFKGETVRRYGLTAKVALEPFEKKIILPHERTFSKVKSERLELIKLCHANFSPIFSLYTDSENILNTLVAAAGNVSPEMDFIDDAGHRHLMWRLTDPELHQSITTVFHNKPLFIADGHHRYETALNFRNWLKDTQPDFDTSHPANFIMMSLSSISDPGLVILPAHRILTAVPAEIRETFISTAENYFDIISVPAGHEGRVELMSRLEPETAGNRFGVVIKNQPLYYLLTLKPGVMDRLFEDELPPALRHLDVTVLTRLIFMEILKFDQERLDNEKAIMYSSTEDGAFEAVEKAGQDICFILNPTKIKQVRQVSEQGLIMPRKSTYFYPKVITGQVMNDLKP